MNLKFDSQAVVLILIIRNLRYPVADLGNLGGYGAIAFSLQPQGIQNPQCIAIKMHETTLILALSVIFTLDKV